MNEAIQSHQREIEVTVTKLSDTLLKIREAGGWCWRMDVKGITYVLHVHWNVKEEKQIELLQ